MGHSNRSFRSVALTVSLALLSQLLVASSETLTASGADLTQPNVNLGPWTKPLRVGPGAVFSGQRLWGTEIVGHDLTNGSFDDCDLAGVILRECNLTGVSFRRAVLSGCAILDCKLKDNTFIDAVINDLDTGAPQNMPSWDLGQLKSTLSYKRKNLDDCHIRIRGEKGVPLDLQLDDFSLHRTLFYEMDLTNTGFEGAKFSRLTMSLCRLNADNFSKASGNLSDSGLDITLSDGRLNLDKHYLWGTTISGQVGAVTAIDARIDFLRAGPWLDRDILETTRNYHESAFEGCHFYKANLKGTDFSRKILLGCHFGGCDLTGSRFADAVISKTTFNECRGLTVDQIDLEFSE